MVLVVALLVEALSAPVTGERLARVMDAQMSVACGRSVESLVALRTHMRLVVCVDDLVSAEGDCLAECLTASLGKERSKLPRGP